MVRKSTFLVVIVFSILFILIVNAQEAANESTNQSSMEDITINGTIDFELNETTINETNLNDTMIGQELNATVNATEQEAVIENGTIWQESTNLTYSNASQANTTQLDFNETSETVNAAQEEIQEYDGPTSNDISVPEAQNEETIPDASSLEAATEEGKAVRASFGVYLQIVE